MTVKDVAGLAGVPAVTVSRVINNDPRISEKTRTRVKECMNRFSYRVNSTARRLKTNKTCTIGFICPELSNTFNITVGKDVEDELEKHGYGTIITPASNIAAQSTWVNGGLVIYEGA